MLLDIHSEYFVATKPDVSVDVVHGPVEPSLVPVELLERGECQEAAAHDEKCVHGGIGVEQNAVQWGLGELR